MDDKTVRLFSALGLLAVVWIVVYWSWPAGGLAVTGASQLEDLGPATGGATEPVVLEPPAKRPEATPPAESFARHTPGEVVEPAQDARPAGGVIPPRFTDYLVQPDDNFMTISRKVYGTTRHWDAIAGANPLLSPKTLRAGQVIRVPVDPSNVQGKPAEDEGKPAAPAALTIEYTVKRGDTLSDIAKSFYGSIRHVDFLYEANRDRLRSKNDLKLGQVLLIPPLPEGAGD